MLSFIAINVWNNKIKLMIEKKNYLYSMIIL